MDGIMWFNVLGMGIKTAAKLYSDKQKTKEALSEARLLHAEKMRRGEIEYKGKVFEHIIMGSPGVQLEEVVSHGSPLHYFSFTQHLVAYPPVKLSLAST